MQAAISITPTAADALLKPYAARCAVLMPSFGKCTYRIANQKAVQRWYTERGFTVVLGHDTRTLHGHFSRARAINTAARETHKTHNKKDIYILADNDLIPSIPHLASALEQLEHYNVITPHQWTLHSSFAGRNLLLEGERTFLYKPMESGSRSYVVVRKESFLQMNGMDELFEGWGPEDKAFMISAHKQVGRVLDMDGSRIHLWHPMDHSKRDRAQLMRNRARCKQYEAASSEEASVLAREYGPLLR